MNVVNNTVVYSPYYKTEADWNAITASTGNRLVPSATKAGVIDSSGLLLYEVLGDSVNDIFSLPVISGEKVVTFSQDLIFSGTRLVSETQQTGAITLTINATQPLVGYHVYIVVIDGNSTDSITLPSVPTTGVIDNTTRNYIKFEYFGNFSGTVLEKTIVTITNTPIPV